MYKNTIVENDEHWRDNLLGLTMDKRVEDAIHQRARRESASFMLKQLRKDLDVRMNMHESARACRS